MSMQSFDNIKICCKRKSYNDIFYMPKYGTFKSYREMSVFLYKNFRELKTDIMYISEFIDSKIIYYIIELDKIIDPLICQRTNATFVSGNFDGLAPSLWELSKLSFKLRNYYFNKYSNIVFATASDRLKRLGLRNLKASSVNWYMPLLPCAKRG